ncbi:hypothetical protein F183_A50560 [Bryobacterales bacterium F-183]|nr:hypothetical protein F183_A50560 [Bryobacterales bacterium F-183]
MSEPQERSVLQTLASIISGPIPKIDSALGGALHKTAESFSRMVDDNNRWMELNAKEQLEATRNNRLLHTSVLVNTKIANGVASVLQGFGNGLVDVLAFGEFEREGSLGGAVKDGLRVMTVVDVGGAVKGGLRLFSPLANRFVRGGPMSCFATSCTKAMNLSGQRFSLSIDEVAQGVGLTERRMLDSAFNGVSYDTIPHVSNILRRIGVDSVPVNLVGDVAKFDQIMVQLQRAVNATQDSHVFAFKWKGSGGHYMTAYTSGGKVKFTDQFGTWVLQEGRMVNIHPTALGKSKQFLKFEQSAVEGVFPFVTRVKGATTVPRTSFTLLDAGGHALLGADPTLLEFAPVSLPKLELALKGWSLKKGGGQGSEASLKSKSTSHTVKVGDTLFGLAKLYYKDAAKYDRIKAANPAVQGLEGHKQLPIGVTVTIP